MTMRARIEKRMTFLRPFVLKGLEGVQPPGTYSVETREDRIGFFSFLKAKRTSTWIRVCRNPGTAGVLQTVNIDPLDLEAALMRDAATAQASFDRKPSQRTVVMTTESRQERADPAAEVRSEDDVMQEHPRKAADPAAWVARAGSRVSLPATIQIKPMENPL